MRSLRAGIDGLEPSPAAKKIVQFCFGGNEAGHDVQLDDRFVGFSARASAAGQVVAALPYRDSDSFKVAALDEVRRLIPETVSERSFWGLVEGTLRVFDPPSGLRLLSELRGEVTEVVSQSIAQNVTAPLTELLKNSTDILVGATFGVALPWRSEVAAHVEDLMEHLKLPLQDLRAQVPIHLADRILLNRFRPEASEALDEGILAHLRSWKPYTSEEVYQMAFLECALAEQSVFTRGSEPAAALVWLFEGTIERWKFGSGGNPAEAATLARELAPICGSILLTMRSFPELRGSRFELLEVSQRQFLEGMAIKAVEAGCPVHEFFSFLAGGKKSDITPRSIVDGFREFLSKSSYEEFVSGLRGWWRFLRQVLEPQPSLQPQVQWRRAQRLLEDYILRQNRALLRAAESAAAALELIAAAEGKEAATRAAVSASHVVKKFVELYSRCCQVYGVRDEQPLCRLVLGTPDDTNEEATPVLNEAADESTSEQPSSSDDSTLVFDNVPNQAQNHRAVVCRAVVSAISDWVQMARWATQHLGISLTGDLMPEELRFGEELVDILSYDASRDPAEVRWAYATHVLRLLAAPAVRRLARYGGASEPVIMDAMREVLAEQGKIDWSSDTVTRFDV